MANNNFRSDRGRDPLAELARLIGQADQSSAGMSRNAYGTARPRAAPAREPDWAPEEHYEAPAPRGEARYAAQPAANPANAPSDHHSSHQAQDRYQDAGYQDPRYQDPRYQDPRYQDPRYQDPRYQDPRYQEQAYQDQGYSDQGADHAYQDQGFDQQAGSRFFSGTAGQFNGFREEPGYGLEREGSQHDYDDAPPQMPQAHDLPVFAFAADDPRYQGDEQHYATDEAPPAEYAYRRRNSGPRTALVAVMAVLGLVVVGSAAAFGYRAMFGGSVLPTLPPIIRASNGPNKIALDPQAGAAASNAQAVATTGSTEHLVSREEQPVAIEAPKTPPRVVATIPVVGSGQNSIAPGMTGMAAMTTAQNGPNRMASADPPWPAPPAPAAAPAAAALAAAPPQPPQVSSEPKKIHTVTIRTDQTGAVPDSATPSATASVARPQSRAAAGGGAAPMSIVPGQGEAAAPAPRVRTAVANTAPSAAPSSAGSYVQVTSRRSEAAAQAEFRAQQARFPDQLNGREPVIRRADLGEKGTFYRALVGPFASAEEAAQLCGSLKAAGGNCIVQRN
jgi:SPOR domain